MKNLKCDLRSPLWGITGLLDLLITEDKDRLEVQSSDLSIIKESVQSILDLLNGSMYAEETEKSLEEITATDRLLTSAMMEINRLYLPMAQAKGISLSLRTQIDTEVQLLPKFFIHLIKITGHLVGNAIKFTPSKGLVDVVFTLNDYEDESILNMTVTDSGITMSHNQISVFNQGKPVPRSAETNGKEGFGNGLQHVKKMVSDTHGHIIVMSEKDKGTLFSLSFPLPGNHSPRIDTSHFIVNDGTISYNGHHR
ncbi:HAMP domain-containing sensor histidine kinase [Rhodohalobacter sp. SW132]|uniref:sensor histidine kinase n=1 Tax=Rhodohalobacter sp. SW132 TaxID=2293433 RepID=UPI0013145A1A|nr:HAMP domain-containing sensor histidine kinase [Rhodohalobacter sp. SW132]